jgi:hypothetical protein
VIDDVRFPNEVNFIRQRGGVVLRLARTEPVICPGHDDESETALDEMDFDGYVVAGEGALELLEARTIRELQQYGVL